MTQLEAYELLESVLYHIYTAKPFNWPACKIVHRAIHRLLMEMPLDMLENLEIIKEPSYGNTFKVSTVQDLIQRCENPSKG